MRRFFLDLIRRWMSLRCASGRRPSRFQPELMALEDRFMPSTMGFGQIVPTGAHAPYSPLRGLRNDNDPIQGGRAEIVHNAGAPYSPLRGLRNDNDPIQAADGRPLSTMPGTVRQLPRT